MTRQRPVNLDLTTFKFPVTSHASILHRMSGFVIFLLIPMFLIVLGSSLESQQGYDAVVGLGDSVLCRLILGVLAAATFYHVVAGIRHLIMDMGFWETLESGTLSAKVTLAVGLGGAAIVFLLVLF